MKNCRVDALVDFHTDGRREEHRAEQHHLSCVCALCEIWPCLTNERSCSNSLPLVAKWTVRKSNWTASARFNDVAGYLGPSLDGALTETTVLPVTEHDEMVDAALLMAKVK